MRRDLFSLIKAHSFHKWWREFFRASSRARQSPDAPSSSPALEAVLLQWESNDRERLGKDLFDDAAVDVGQAEITPCIAIGQGGMFQPEQM